MNRPRPAQNLELIRHLHPELFGSEFPESYVGTLDAGWTVICAFNPMGSLLVSGCNDGRLFLWDFETKSVALCLINHTSTITSLAWNNDGRMILSGSTDFSVCLWDLSKRNVAYTPFRKVRFGSRVLDAKFNPANENIIVVSLHLDSPVLCNLETGVFTPIYPTTSIMSLFATFSTTGKHIYVSRDGGIDVLDAETLENTRRIEVCNSSIKSLYAHPTEKLLLASCADRTLRLLNVETGQKIDEFLDPIDRPDWKCATMSPNGDMVAAGTVKEQRIYGWVRDMDSSSLASVFNINQTKEKECVMYLQWHPFAPTIVCVTTKGVMSVWTRHLKEKWSAYLPEFEELEQNKFHEEPEDCFDLKERKELVAHQDQMFEQVDIDVERDDVQFTLPLHHIMQKDVVLPQPKYDSPRSPIVEVKETLDDVIALAHAVKNSQ